MLFLWQRWDYQRCRLGCVLLRVGRGIDAILGLPGNSGISKCVWEAWNDGVLDALRSGFYSWLLLVASVGAFACVYIFIIIYV